MIDNQVVIDVQALLYFTQLVSWVTHGFMQTNLWMNETNNKAKKEQKKKWKKNK